MPNTLDATGLTIASTDETASDLVAAFQGAYGTDINTDPASPDGQLIGVVAQLASDYLDLVSDVYTSFDPDAAYGVSLQSLCKINGLKIKPGTYTTTPVNITVGAADTLPGLDQTAQPPYQVRDAANTWTLVSTFAFGAPGTQALVFRAATFGPITPLPNTINAQATPRVAVTVVNNPSTAGTVLGVEEETDVALRTRRAKSTSYGATGPADAVEAALLDLPNVTDALVLENRTGAVDANGTAAHSLRCIVVGGAAADIAQAIYAKSSCAGLQGAVVQNVVRPNGQVAPINYDVGVGQRLWAQFGIIPAVPNVTFDDALLEQELAAALLGYFKLNGQASVGDLVRAMFVIEPRAIVINAGVSKNGSAFSDNLAPDSPTKYFTLAAGDITIA